MGDLSYYRGILDGVNSKFHGNIECQLECCYEKASFIWKNIIWMNRSNIARSKYTCI